MLRKKLTLEFYLIAVDLVRMMKKKRLNLVGDNNGKKREKNHRPMVSPHVIQGFRASKLDTTKGASWGTK